MQTYREYRPTQFDPSGLNGESVGISDWLVAPCGRNRDSECLQESNFHSFLRGVGGESKDVQVHRFGHWACGWFEIIVIRPHTDAATKAQKMADALEDYPVVDESDWSDREYRAKAQYWENYLLRERVDMCREAGESIFAARRYEIPDGVYDRMEV